MDLDQAWRERFEARQEVRSVAAIQAVMENAMNLPISSQSVPTQAAAVRGMVERLLDEKALLRQEIERLQKEQSRQHSELTQVRSLLQERNRLILDLQQEKDVLEATVKRLQAEALPFTQKDTAGYPYDLRELYNTLSKEKESFKEREAHLRKRLRGERAENKLLRMALRKDVRFQQEANEVELEKVRDRFQVLEMERNDALQRSMKAAFVNAMQKNQLDMLNMQLEDKDKKQAFDLAKYDELSLAKNRLEHQKQTVTQLQTKIASLQAKLQQREQEKDELEAEVSEFKLQQLDTPSALTNVILQKANQFAFNEITRFRKIARKMIEDRRKLLDQFDALQYARHQTAAEFLEEKKTLQTESAKMRSAVDTHVRAALLTKSHLIAAQSTCAYADEDGIHEEMKQAF